MNAVEFLYVSVIFFSIFLLVTRLDTTSVLCCMYNCTWQASGTGSSARQGGGGAPSSGVAVCPCVPRYLCIAFIVIIFYMLFEL